MQANVSLRIRELRARANGMSQAELARRSGLSKVTISNLESGNLRRIELETVGKLCRALCCTPDDLFELPALTEQELVQRQKQSIRELMGSLKYGDAFAAERVDADLVAITAREMEGALRVAEEVERRRKRRKNES